MTALGFQTGSRHYTSPASLWCPGRERGEGGESKDWMEKADKKEREREMRKGRDKGRDETRKREGER